MSRVDFLSIDQGSVFVAAVRCESKYFAATFAKPGDCQKKIFVFDSDMYGCIDTLRLQLFVTRFKICGELVRSIAAPLIDLAIYGATTQELFYSYTALCFGDGKEKSAEIERIYSLPDMEKSCRPT